MDSNLNFSGGMYALVAAHIAQLLLNWHNDAFVLRQRVNIYGAGFTANGVKKYKPPVALPMNTFSHLVRIGRLFCAGLTLIVTLKLHCTDSKFCDTDISHATHTFGALFGLLTGCIFLRVRSTKRPIRVGQNILLVLVYGLAALWMFAMYMKTYDDEWCPWIEYERVCQDRCYRKSLNSTKTICTNVNINIC